MDEVKYNDVPQNVKVETATLPDGVHGVITALDGDKYLIVLNSNDNEERRQQALRHELRHYYNGDLEGTGTVNEIEKHTHLQEGRLTNGKD